MVKWNLNKLAEALDPVIDLEHSTNFVRKNFDELFCSVYNTRMAQKLGFILTSPADGIEKETGMKKNIIKIGESRDLTNSEIGCIKSLFETMQATGSDFTDTFRFLNQF